MSKHIIAGKNGSKLELNFTYDNGLPTKPIINPAYDAGYSKEKNLYVLTIYLTNEDLIQLGKISIEKLFFFEDEQQLWLEINNKYVVFGKVPDKIIKQAKEKELIYFFRKENGEFIKGTKIEWCLIKFSK